jgi:hypothetical protein
VSFEVLIVVPVKIIVAWDVTLYILVDLSKVSKESVASIFRIGDG